MSSKLYSEMNQAERTSFDHDTLMDACGMPTYRQLTDINASLLSALQDARERMMGSSPAIVALRNKTDAAIAKANKGGYPHLDLSGGISGATLTFIVANKGGWLCANGKSMGLLLHAFGWSQLLKRSRPHFTSRQILNP